MLAVIDTRLRRFEGRLFAEDGMLFLVVAADHVTETARVSCRVEGTTQVVDMPISEVARRLTANPDLKLDNLNGPNAAKRIACHDGEWFFTSREGLQGPFETADAAKHGLARHILRMQTAVDADPAADGEPLTHPAAAPDGESETVLDRAPTRGERRRNPDPAASRADVRSRASDRTPPLRAARAPAAG